jgi:hypothetical protein
VKRLLKRTRLAQEPAVVPVGIAPTGASA